MEASPSGEAGDRRPSALLRGRALSHSSDMAQKVVEDHLAVHTLIRAYQVPVVVVGGGFTIYTLKYRFYIYFCHINMYSILSHCSLPNMIV